METWLVVLITLSIVGAAFFLGVFVLVAAGWLVWTLTQKLFDSQDKLDALAERMRLQDRDMSQKLIDRALTITCDIPTGQNSKSMRFGASIPGGGEEEAEVIETPVPYHEFGDIDAV